MTCRLAANVQVRTEDWGLLFYQPSRHKVCFVRSGSWLTPGHFDGTWTFDAMIGDIARRTGTPGETVERLLLKLTRHLAANRMILDEVY